MPVVLLPSFIRFPAEAAIIGRLLAGYGELEFDLVYLAGHVLKNHDQTFRILYRVKTEGNRLDVADAIIRPALPNDGIRGQYANTIGAIHICKAIRNSYAHCHWLMNEARTGIIRTSIEEFARKENAPSMATTPVKLAILEQQEAYYVFVIQCLDYLNAELGLLINNGDPHQLKFPKILPPPPV